MQFLSAVSPHPFSTPSWKVETKYSTRVLTGNWVEERRKFTKATEKTPQSIYRKEYVPFPGHRPDQISRWYGKRRVEGLPHRHLLAGHQEPCRRHLISTYDDHYNRRGHNPALPARRTWNGHQLLWLPERSDFPLLGTRRVWGREGPRRPGRAQGPDPRGPGVKASLGTTAARFTRSTGGGSGIPALRSIILA
uniref:Cilia and flagella associated protein 107 n=1 Tax=Canis lupus familiaris TaxID=9615 RepID=A0A8I3MEN7_CANLF